MKLDVFDELETDLTVLLKTMRVEFKRVAWLSSDPHDQIEFTFLLSSRFCGGYRCVNRWDFLFFKECGTPDSLPTARSLVMSNWIC